MEAGFFTTVFSQPLYNGLIFLMHWVPDAGVAIIIFTTLVRLLLYPLSKKSIVTQLQLKASEGEIHKIKTKFKDDKRVQAEQIMAFYRQRGINPLSGFILILIQIPIIFALYYIFLRSGLPEVNMNLLYSFITAPAEVNMHFLSLLDISEKSYLLAFICSVSQFFQIKYSLPKVKPRESTDTFKDDLARSMNVQMKYIFPVVVFFIAYSLSGTVALYWITSNLFAIGQELYVRRKVVPQ